MEHLRVIYGKGSEAKTIPANTDSAIVKSRTRESRETLTTENGTVFAPMPSANVKIAIVVNPGDFTSIRNP